MSALLHLGCVSVLPLFASIRRQPLSQRQFDGQECGGTNALQCSVMRASEMGGGLGSCRPPKRFSSSTGHANRAPGLRLPWEWANIWDSPEGPESAAKVAQAGIGLGGGKVGGRIANQQ